MEKEAENTTNKPLTISYKNLKIKEFLKIRLFYRNNSYKKENWYKGKHCDSNIKAVMFVDATPGETLTKI